MKVPLDFGHLGAVDGHIAVHVDLWSACGSSRLPAWLSQNRQWKGRCPADEVIELGVGVRFPVAVEVDVAALVAQVLERRHVADGASSQT